MSRTVRCARETGVGGPTCKAEDKPSSSRDCADYGNCPYMPLCPGGPPNPSCATQAGLLLTGIFVLLFCVAGCVGRVVYVKCRRPLEGKSAVSGSDDRLSWHVEPGEEGETQDENADKREHVIWDVDHDTVQTVAPSPEPLQPVPAASPEPVADVEVAEDNAAAEVVLSVAETEARIQERREKWLQEVLPIIGDQERVEYFSSTNKDWIPGTLHITFQEIEMLDVKDEDMRPPSQRILYSVITSRGKQSRTDTKIDCIRRQFRSGEAVDIFTKRANGTWAAGTIRDEPPLSATSIGYRVYASDADVVLEKVPALRLRHRYFGGSAVEVYRGADKGWSPAVVHSCISAGQREPGPEPLGASSPGSLEGIAFQAWTMVPVYTEDEDAIVEPEPEWLPSYYVRCVSFGDGDADRRSL